MPGLWIRVQAALARDPKVGRLADLLALPTPHALGHVVCVWGAVAEHAASGDISTVSRRTFEEWAMWTGKRGAFNAAFRRIFTDDQGHLSHWFEYQGKLIERNERAAAHMREVRARRATQQAAPLPAPVPECAGPAAARAARKKSSRSAQNEEAPNPRMSLLTPVERVWREFRPQAAFKLGHVGNALEPVFDAGATPEQVADQLRLCLAEKFYSWEKFAEGYGTFTGKAPTRFASREDATSKAAYQASLDVEVVTAPAEDE